MGGEFSWKKVDFLVGWVGGALYYPSILLLHIKLGKTKKYPPTGVIIRSSSSSILTTYK